MKLEVRIDGELVTAGLKHLSRKPSHELTVRVLDKDGELVDLQVEQVECWLPPARRERGPSLVTPTATFAFSSVRRGRIECVYKQERARIRVIGFYTGLLWSALALLILCAPIGGAIALKTVIHLDADLKLFETAAENAFQLFGFGSGLIGLLVGLPAVQETIKSKSAEPVLGLLTSPGGTVALLISLALSALMIAARPRIYTNATSSDIAVPGGGAWKPHELWLLRQESWLRPPLKASRNPLSENDLEQWLAGKRVECTSWWPKVESGVGQPLLELSDGCTKVVASAKSERAQIEVAFGTSSGEHPSPATLTIDQAGLKASPAPPELLRGSVALLGNATVGGGRFSLQLGPGTSLSDDAELQTVRLSGTFDALDRRALVLPVKKGGLLHATLHTDAPSSALMGELSCIARTDQTLLFISNPTLQLKEAQLLDKGVWLSSWSQKSSQLQTFVAVCLPGDRKGFVLVLEVADRWQPDPSWQLELPPEISRVDLRLADGRLLGSASFQCPASVSAVAGTQNRDCTEPWLLATHYLDSDDASSENRGLRRFRTIEDAAGYGQWQRAPEDTGLHRQWFWLPNIQPMTGKEQQCRGSFEYPSRAFPCPAGRKASYPARTCFFDNGQRVAGCAQGRARPPRGDEAPDNLRAGCDKVLVCAG